jgi:hypothetical protein
VDSVLSIDVILEICFTVGGERGRERGCYETLWMNDRAIDGATVAVGTIITDRPRTDPYVRVYAYGSYHGSMAAKLNRLVCRARMSWEIRGYHIREVACLSGCGPSARE